VPAKWGKLRPKVRRFHFKSAPHAGMLMLPVGKIHLMLDGRLLLRCTLMRMLADGIHHPCLVGIGAALRRAARFRPDLGNLLRTRLSQKVVLWPDQAIPLAGYICHPNDPAAREELLGTLKSW